MALTTNINFLSPVEFQFALKRLPNVQFFVQTANVPGITSGSTTRVTPFKDLDEPGDKLSYDDFTVNIICDEGMETYREISDWLVALTYPKSFDQYASLNPETFGSGGSAINVDGDGIKSDGTLLILNSNKNPSVKVKFSGLFPIAVGSIELNTAGDVTPPTFSVTFKYESYTISV